jgi:superfamily I DNA/RNA helicase
MDTWIDIRRMARICHETALAKAGGDRRAVALITAALKNDDLVLRHDELGSGILGSLDRSARLVTIAPGQDAADENLVIAHEIGHFHLHNDPSNEVSAVPETLGGDPIDSGAGRVEGYSPRERKEVQADVFAGEFLCPSDWLRAAYLKDGKRPPAIAAELGLPLTLVSNQTARALLLPPLRPTPEEFPSVERELDESQEAAAAWNGGPLIVDAGPGTGKTRTLTHRVKYLLENGANAGSILILTFSNKAAEELRERLSAMIGDRAIEMWIGTFHAFGLELLRKWPVSVGRTQALRVLDQTGSLAILEENLHLLPLNYYQNLYEPAYELVTILKAISRCKDELISCDAYEAAAKKELEAAGSDDALEQVGKLLEIAAVYRIYEQALRDSDSVDFGDLVALTVELIRANKDVRDYLAGFKHVLVDEYQDVNFASAALLREICNAGADIWVVADRRQSIYRFRGAEPQNVSNFETAFGGSVHRLENNYRSFSPIVRVFEMFSRAMRSGTGAASWEATRGFGGRVSLTEAPDVAAEGEVIAAMIREMQKAGVPYGEQAILARSHLTLARLTDVIEREGVPLLYLGDLFERPEIRDLLSLIAIDAEAGGLGLVRVATLPDYRVLRTETLALIRWAQSQKLSIFAALMRVSEIEEISELGRSGLLKLAAELEGLQKASPLVLLFAWLFERSAYLRPLLDAGDPKSQQKLIAIYHLLKVSGEFAAGGETSRKRFLDRIRRIELLNSDTPYRAVSSEASDMDAVRVMTIHGSKGLEFQAVHLPALATTYMPSNWRGIRVPAPSSLPQLTLQQGGHDAEEECLFFVSLSRARDYLLLSRADTYTTRRSNPSRFLSHLGNLPTTQFRGSSRRSPSVVATLLPALAKQAYPEKDLDLYMKCPARYHYLVLDELRGGHDESAFLQFHGAVYRAISWLETEKREGRAIARASAMERFAAVWAEAGPIGHPFEKYYRVAAERMVDVMTGVIASETCSYERKEWSVPVGSRRVSITPDRVLIETGGSIRVQRIRTGRPTKKEHEKPIYALLRRGAQLAHPGQRVTIEIFYLSTSEIVAVLPGNDDKRIDEYREAIDGIERGDFRTTTETRSCPSCPAYFICSSKVG